MMRPPPHNLRELAAKHSMRQIQMILKACNKTVQRWFAEEGIKSGGAPSALKADLPDFETFAAVEPPAALAKRYGLTPSCIYRRLREIGQAPVQRVRTRAAPDDFAALAPTFTLHDACKHWRASHHTAKGWYRAAGIEPARRVYPKTIRQPRRPKGPPENFATVARDMTLAEAAKHFGISIKRAMRYKRELGMGVAKEHGRRASQPFRRAMPERASVRPYRGKKMAALASQRDDSHAGQAADFMRRRGWVVFRVDDRGQPNAKGRRFQVGRLTLSIDELIEMAETKGFEPARFWDVAA